MFIGEYYAQLLGMKNVTIITVEGFKKVGEYEYKGEDNEDDKKKKLVWNICNELDTVIFIAVCILKTFWCKV